MAFPGSDLPTPLAAAERAARFIASARRRADGGLTWVVDPDEPERPHPVGSPHSYYAGSAGVVMFLLELAATTGDQSYLDDAAAGADHLVATWRTHLDFAGAIPLPGYGLTLYGGVAGVAYALAEVWRATGESRYAETASAIGAHLVERAGPHGWTGTPTVLGDAGITLALLRLAEVLGDPAAATRAAATRLVEAGESDPRGGLRWSTPGPYRPGFNAGTAGVAFTLVRAYEVTGDADYLYAARRGGEHLAAVATVADDAAVVFRSEPDETDLYLLGACAGSVGVARLFAALAKSDEGDGEWAGRFARGITASGVPDRQAPGLWYTTSQCCGLAGVLDLFVALGDLTTAQRVADQLLSRAMPTADGGLRWYQAWARTDPRTLAAETGFQIGAAGVGSALLRLHRAHAPDVARAALPVLPDR